MQPLPNSKKQLWITIAIAVVVFLAGILIAILFRSQLDAAGSVIQGWMHPAPKAETQLPKANDLPKTTETPKVDEHALKIQWVNPSNGKFTHVDFPDALLPLAVASIDISSATDDKGNPLSKDALKKSLAPYGMNVGSVVGGIYDGYALNVEHWTDAFGMGATQMEVYFLIGPAKQYVLLGKYGATETFYSVQQDDLTQLMNKEALATFGKTQKIDMETTIPEFEIPASLKDANGNTFSFYGMVFAESNSSVATDLRKVAVHIDAVNPIDQAKYTLALDDLAKDPFLYFVRPDGRTVQYSYDIPWISKQTTDTTKNQDGVSVNWSDGIVTDGQKYASAASSGCGTISPDVLSVIPKMTAAGTVKDASGKTYQIFQPVWTEQDTTVVGSDAANLYGNYVQRLSWDAANKDTASFSAFIKMHPVYFWQDPFGRWLRFTNENVQTAAECGKPVIYLYPTVTTPIDVFLAPKGGFTYTEPVYKNGWRVTASPDGTLVNRDDGKTYPYLFWEGRGAAYTSPQDFWVVKKNDVHRFLNETLSKIGLNKKETADFQEFWEPKMQSAPYYKIGFHGTTVMNEIAPMSLSKTPDSVLRILMDYTELQTPITQHPPKLSSTFVRNGFTVVEWGGVLR